MSFHYIHSYITNLNRVFGLGKNAFLIRLFVRSSYHNGQRKMKNISVQKVHAQYIVVRLSRVSLFIVGIKKKPTKEKKTMKNYLHTRPTTFIIYIFSSIPLKCIVFTHAIKLSSSARRKLKFVQISLPMKNQRTQFRPTHVRSTYQPISTPSTNQHGHHRNHNQF